MTGRARTRAPEPVSKKTPAAAQGERATSRVPTDAGPEAVADALRDLGPSSRADAVRSLQRSRGNRWMEGMATGRPLPDAVRARMEVAFGADFSDVTVREDHEAVRLDAAAFTRGAQITFHPGMYHPESADGQETLAHELAHVLQQRAGRAGGSGVDEHPALEAEAAAAGERVARGAPVWDTAQATSSAPPSGAGPAAAVPVQRTGLRDKLFGRRGRGAPQQSVEPAHQQIPPDLALRPTPYQPIPAFFGNPHDPIPSFAETPENPYDLLPADWNSAPENPYDLLPADWNSAPENPYDLLPAFDAPAPQVWKRGRIPESPYQNIPMAIQNSNYANIPPEIVARAEARRARYGTTSPPPRPKLTRYPAAAPPAPPRVPPPVPSRAGRRVLPGTPTAPARQQPPVPRPYIPPRRRRQP